MFSPVKEILEMPPRNYTAFPHAGLLCIGWAKQLHPHHGKYEDDDDQDEGQIGEGPQCWLHDPQDVVERLPRLGELEHPEQSEGSQHWESLYSLRQQLHDREDNNDEIKIIGFILQQWQHCNDTSTLNINNESYREEVSGSHGKQFSKGLEGKNCSEK